MRTTEQIIADMDSIQDTIPEAAVLTSKSKTAVFGLLRTIWAALVQALEKQFDTLKSDLTAYVATIQVGSIAWYVSQVKAFQYGDSLTLVGGRPGYATINAAKQIVIQCAVTETDGRLLIKTAKAPDGNVFEYSALTGDQLSALKEYVRQIKYAGVIADVVSLPADELKIVADVKYNRLLLNSGGQLLTEPTRLPAVEAILLYIRSIPFDSVLNWTALTDYAQAYLGVSDFFITRTYIRPAGATVWTEFSRETTSRSGHLKLAEYTINYV